MTGTDNLTPVANAPQVRDLARPGADNKKPPTEVRLIDGPYGGKKPQS